jgi:hypothetical protein
MDMDSLQAALPNPQVPDAFLEAFSGYPTSLAQGQYLFSCAAALLLIAIYFRLHKLMHLATI